MVSFVGKDLALAGGSNLLRPGLKGEEQGGDGKKKGKRPHTPVYRGRERIPCRKHRELGVNTRS